MKWAANAVLVAGGLVLYSFLLGALTLYALARDAVRDRRAGEAVDDDGGENVD